MDLDSVGKPLSEPVAVAAAPRAGGQTPRLWWWLLLLVLAVHGELRAWYATEIPQLFDERYSIENMRLILVEGNWRPSSAYYPRLSYLPQAAVVEVVSALESIGGHPTPVFNGAQISRRDFLICRFVVVGYAVVSLLLVFLLARRWFSPATAFFAVVFVASLPIHFRLSIEFKPDLLVLALSLLTLLLGAIALDRGGWRWFLAAGAASGLAASAKLTGGVAAMPLAIGALWRSRREPRQLLRLTAAGIAAVVVLLLINPDLFRYLHRLFGIVDAYEDRPDRRPGSGFFSELLLWLLSPSGHGRIVGVLALAGLVGLAAMLAVPRWRARLPFSYGPVVVGFPIVFVTVYRVLSDYFKPNNFLPLLPFTAMGAAWLLVLGWTQIEKLLPGGRAPLATVAAVVLVVFASWPVAAIAAAEISRNVVDIAIEKVESSAPSSGAPGAVVVEGPTGRIAPRAAAVHVVADLANVPAAQLACTDAEIFPAQRLSGPNATVYRDRLAAGQPLRVTASLVDLVYGDDVMVIRHPRPLRNRQEIPRNGPPPYVVELPGTLPPGSCVSVAFEIGRASTEVPRVLLDGTELPLRAVRVNGRRVRTTDRIPITATPQKLTIEPPAGQRPRRGLRLQLLSW